MEFFKQNKLTESLTDMIKHELSNKECLKYEYGDTFHPFTISQCPRRLIYRSNKLISQKHYIQKTSQIYHRRKWIDYLTKCNELTLMASEIVISDNENCNIGCIIDAIFEYQDNRCVFKFNAVDNDTYDKIKKNGALKKDVMGVIIQEWLSETKYGFLIYENKNDGKFEIYYVKLLDFIINSTVKKCKELMNHKKMGTLPHRPYENKEANECQSCEFLKECWGGKTKES